MSSPITQLRRAASAVISRLDTESAPPSPLSSVSDLDSSTYSSADDTGSEVDDPIQFRSYSLCTKPPSGAVEDGSSECFLSDRALVKIDENKDRGYPHELLHPLDGPSYKIVPVDRKGLGLCAMRAVDPGSLIMTERAMMIVPVPKQSSTPVLTDEQLGTCLRRMDETSQKSFRSLTNSFPELGPIRGVFRTNGLEIYGLDNVDEGTSYVGVFKDMSRINHSCRPNASLSFDLTTFAMRLTAVRSIKKGEEICIAYCELEHQLSAARQEALWFPCACQSCADSEASDARRADIFRINPWELADSFYSWILDNTFGYDVRLRDLKELIEEEGLEDTYWYRLVLKQLAGVAFAFDDAENVARYLDMVRKAYAGSGMATPDVIEVLEALEMEYLRIIGVKLGPVSRSVA